MSFMLKHHAATAMAAIDMRRPSNRIMDSVIEIRTQKVEDTFLKPLSWNKPPSDRVEELIVSLLPDHDVL